SETRFHWLALDLTSAFASGRLPSSGGTGLDWQILKVATDPTILLSTDWPIALSQDGRLYYQSGVPRHFQIIWSLPSRRTSVFANLPATSSGQPLSQVNGLSAGPDGSLYYTENNAVRRITPRGLVGTVVTVPALVDGPSIPGTDQHPYLRELAVDANGTMYVA